MHGSSFDYKIINKMENRIFYNSLIISLVVHISFIGYFTFTQTKIISPPAKEIEVTYQILKQITSKKSNKESRQVESVKEQKPVRKKMDIDIVSKEGIFPSSFERKLQDISKMVKKIKFGKKEIPKINISDGERNIFIPEFKPEKATDPRYSSYLNNIRNSIRDRAFEIFDSSKDDKGNIHVSFLLNPDGSVNETKINESKSDGSEYLKNIASRAIKEAFIMPFPKGLSALETSFNIEISFR